MQIYYVIKNKEGMFMRKYIRDFKAKDLCNAELFRNRGAAVSANSAAKNVGIITKIEVNLVE